MRAAHFIVNPRTLAVQITLHGWRFPKSVLGTNIDFRIFSFAHLRSICEDPVGFV